MPPSDEEMLAKTNKFALNLDRIDLITNGDEETDVIVDEGRTIPSFAKLAATNILSNEAAISAAEDAAESASLAQQWVDADWALDWTTLSGTGGTAGDKAVIHEDEGTHTDPVTSATVDNAGLYLYTTGWQWVASTEAMRAKEYAEQAADILASASPPEQIRRVTSAMSSGLFPDAAYLLGPYRSNDLSTVSTAAHMTVTDGVATLERDAASTVAHLFSRGDYWSGNDIIDISFDYQVDAGDAVTGEFGPRIALGTSSSDLRIIAYRSSISSSGTFQVQNSSEAVVGGQQSMSRTAMNFAKGDKVTMALHLEPGGTGVVSATNTDGTQFAFAITGIPAGYIWFGVGDARQTHYSNPRIALGQAFDLARLSGVDFRAFGNWYAAVNDSISSTFGFSVTDGVASLSAAADAIYYSNNGLALGGGPMEYWIEAEQLTGTTSTGPLMAFGDSSATRKIVGYLSNGIVGMLDTSGSPQQGWAAGSPTTPNNAMIFGAGERARLHIVAMPDGTAYVTGIHPSGRMETCKVTGLPAEAVSLAWRGTTTGKVHAYGGQPATSDVIAAAIQRATKGNPRAPIRWKVLPSFPADRKLPSTGVSPTNGDYPDMPVPGFTPTGATVPVSGQFRDCYVVGDDGRLTEANPGAQQCHIHILDADCRLILRTITPAVSGSVQGVTLSDVAGSITADPDIWAAFPGDDSIRKYNIVTGAEIGADAITGITALTGAGCNALAFDATQGANGGLWTCDSAATNPTVASLIDIATGEVARTIELPAPLIDHFQIVGRKLIFQYGANGTRANFGCYDLDTNVATATLFGPLEMVYAAEGSVYKPETGIIRTFQDPGFHNSIGSGPRFNSFADTFVGPL